MSTRGLAAVFHEVGRPLELRTSDLPELDTGEALVKITCATVCGSDVHTMRGARPVGGPTVLGHEIVGCIAALPDTGPDVCDVNGKPLAVGDRVTWAVGASCGECRLCRRGIPQKCDALFKYGHETVTRSLFSGGFAEFCHLQRGTAIIQVPDTVPDVVPCPASCATATVAAAVRVASGCQAKSVLIQGAGMLGLTAAAMARAQGATEVIVSDVSKSRLQRCADFGATRTVHVGDDPQKLATIVGEMTASRGVDVIFEMSGAVAAIEQSPALLGIGGQLVLVGSVFPTRAAQLSPEMLVRKLIRIEGVHNYTPVDLTMAMDFLSTDGNRFPFQALVDMEFALPDINQGLGIIFDRTPIRAACRVR